MIQIILGVLVFVVSHRFDVAVFVTVIRSADNDFLTVFQRYDCLLEIRSADYVLIAARTNGIEAQGGKDVPSRGLSVVFVAAIAVGRGSIQAVHDFAQ